MDEYKKADSVTNTVFGLDCKEGVTHGTIASMFLVFFTTFAFSSYCFFVLIFIFEESKYFHMGPAKALSSAAWLIFAGYPFNLMSSMLTGYLFVRFGRQKVILAGFLMSVTGGLLTPFAGQSVFPGMYLCILLIHIGSAWTQNPPLIADYIKPNSIGKAVAIQGFVTSIATLFAIGVIFGSTKHLD